MDRIDARRIVNSVLWSAYGDALGFISERVPKGLLLRRIKAERVTQTIPWKRRVGGRFGVEVNLPAGVYSDDTQLRLATFRAIRGDGRFDVEAFSKIELPVWLAYSLGGGRGSKAAASSLSHESVAWFSNFFDRDNSRYLDSGGNGAAMRIQPHVWSSRNPAEAESFLLDVVKNSICTHGHSRGILGAVFHSLCVAVALTQGRAPDAENWEKMTFYFPIVADMIEQDATLGAFWLPVWEQRSRLKIREAFRQTQDECLNDIAQLRCDAGGSTLEETYRRHAKKIGALDEQTTGTGTKTALLAAALAYLYRRENPEEAMQASANLLSSDTDTIGTMAGAILGAVAEAPPTGEIQDRNYLTEEALRSHLISQGQDGNTFQYPDLLHWCPPRTQQDAVVLINGHLSVLGLGRVATEGKQYFRNRRDGACWQEIVLQNNQTVVIKRKKKLAEVSVDGLETLFTDGRKKPGIAKAITEQPSLFVPPRREQPTQIAPLKSLRRLDAKDLDAMTAEAIRSGFNAELIGKQILEIAASSGGIEKAIAYVAIIVKAKVVRASKEASR
jgi:ADP-ribosylglycohydrolase